MRRVLIISPYFPPDNAADMQRVRMSLPYFKRLGWEAEVVAVNPRFTDVTKDELLLQSLPADVKVHHVGAFNKRWTSKLGLGSIALRSLWFFYKKVKHLLKEGRFDLIYFSTTQFPVCSLGPIWKKRYGIPYVIDFQDPWHSTYYEDKPKNERPPKYWFSYRLNKLLEPHSVENADGLISVSEAYIKTLRDRYEALRYKPSSIITFGAFEPDFKIAIENKSCAPSALTNKTREFSIVYVGRAGSDMQKAIKILLKGIKSLIDKNSTIPLKVYFIGTSYAPNGKGENTVLPIARLLGIDTHVVEITDRISFYRTINTLLDADTLIIPGSDDPQYTASKIFPYILSRKPLISLFDDRSSARTILQKCNIGLNLSLNEPENRLIKTIGDYLMSIIYKKRTVEDLNESFFEKFSSYNMTKNQTDLFNLVINGRR